MNGNPKVLLLSSANPLLGPGVIAEDYYNAFHKYGYECDLLTLFKVETRPNYLYCYKKNNFYYRSVNRFRKLGEIIKYKFLSICNKIRYNPNKGFSFFYKNERNPPISINRVLKNIKKDYDIVMVIFWQGMLSFDTILAVYNKLKCHIRFECVDYSPMAGGCHFPGGCEQYIVGCGNCIAFNSSNPYDFTYQNVQFRKKVYDIVSPLVTGNSYMFSFYDKSYLLKNSKRQLTQPIIDTDLFSEKDRQQLRLKYKIREGNKFLILFGCQNIADERKGIKYLIESLNIFYSNLSQNERASVLLLVIGRDFDKIKSQIIDFEAIELGYVSKYELPDIYSLADVFLCSSIYDAGPMMVNQSLCCGTPVVGFEMGACIDAVLNKGTGFCAKIKDVYGFASGIESLFRLNVDEYNTLRKRCRSFAVNNYSFEVSVNRVISGFQI